VNKEIIDKEEISKEKINENIEKITPVHSILKTVKEIPGKKIDNSLYTYIYFLILKLLKY